MWGWFSGNDTRSVYNKWNERIYFSLIYSKVLLRSQFIFFLVHINCLVLTLNYSLRYFNMRLFFTGGIILVKSLPDFFDLELIFLFVICLYYPYVTVCDFVSLIFIYEIILEILSALDYFRHWQNYRNNKWYIRHWWYTEKPK